MRREAHWVLVMALVFCLGCSGYEDGAERSAADGGKGGVELAGDRVRLDVSGAGQLGLLQQLAEQGGFALELHEINPGAVTLRLEDATLAEAVAAIVGDSAFRIEYVLDRGTKRHVVAALHVGAAPLARPAATSSGTGSPSAPSEPPSAVANRRIDDPAEMDQHAPRQASRRDEIENARERIAPLRDAMKRAKEEERLELQSAYERAQDALQEQLRLALQDPDPMVRQEALEEVDASQGDARQRIGDLARDDPDPRIQVAAIEALSEDGTFQAVSELVTMLDASDDSRVLLAALEALDLNGDESLAPRIEPLANHSDTAVREMA
ncbi:MAG: HEAT repeat domain-containing protein, partial [Deltaproteobacteria bacterium]|nr:HEAT repeat domain-containing protein [Deltaproteobacteria bacterium]